MIIGNCCDIISCINLVYCADIGTYADSANTEEDSTAMKRALCLILAVIMICGTLASCSSLKKGDKGAIITMYLADEIYNFDPMVGFNDTASAKIISLIFEGLTVLDEDGDWKKGMMKDYDYVKPANEGDTYKLLINLRESKWSDGRTVQANDFVYAWKRIMEPTAKCEAACLLYDVKNAYDIKMGDATVDDLGVYAVETYVLQVEFDHDIDVDEFFRTCASVALVPLREDKVGNDPSWAKRASTMVTNGPFDVRKITYGQQLNLERSSYYLRDTEANQALDKYVTPYRLTVYYNYGNAEKQFERFASNDIFYIGQLPISARQDNKKNAEVKDTAITTSYYFNTNNDLFKKPEVRQALSMALDRQAIADAVVFAKAATGFIPYGVNDANGKGEFRKEGGDLISVTADVEGAKKLLKSAGVSKGKFTLSVRNREEDLFIANLVADAWGELGFNVKVEALATAEEPTVIQNQSIVYTDLYQKALSDGAFDVIAVDYNMLAPDAWSALAPFSAAFSGNGVDMESENYDIFTHITGYSDKDYDALIEAAYAEQDSKKKTEILHDAEKKLLEDMPIVPVLFMQDAYMSSKVISHIDNTYWGRDFKKLSMKNYMKYKESIQEANKEDVVAEN